MTPKQIALIQSSFTQLIPVSDSAARFFYNRLFQLDPKLRLLFKGDMQEQGRKLMQTIGLAVSGLNQSEALIAPLRALGSRHVEYGVTSRDYETLGKALIATLEAELGSRFTQETRDAWIAVYNLIASVMQERIESAPCASSSPGRP
jgi:hemoglobin-like flavoprotein